MQTLNHIQGTLLMRLAVYGMTIAAIVWLGYEFWRLVWQQGHWGAIDLHQRYVEVHHWFSGKKVYGQLKVAGYPPASYALLWPLIGWMGFTQARWVWALTTVLALAWFIRLSLAETLPRTSEERTFLALIPLSGYATGATIGNGQMTVHLLPFLVASLLLLKRAENRWRDDLPAAALFIVALAKPSVTLPFCWLALFLPGRIRPAVLIGGGYLGITLFAGLFQAESNFDLMRGFVSNSQMILYGSAIKLGHSNLHSLFACLGLLKWLPPASFLMILALGLWTYVHRHVDVWVLIGVTAIVARVYTYHGWYDDALLFLPMITLFRIATVPGRLQQDATAAGCLLAANLIFMIAPGGLYLFPHPWNMVYVALQTLVWITTLAYLIRYAWLARATSSSAPVGTTAAG